MTKILLIEDEKILRENTCELLELHGFECITAEHGKIGLEKALTEKPDLIICDIMLPHFNGYQIKEALNNLNEHAQIPFIFLSAKVEREDIRKGMDLGAADYITKPFRIAELVVSIKSRLEQSKNIQTSVQAKLIDSITDFIHVAKHECNTPLNGIINLSGILSGEQTNEPEFLEKALLAINKSGKRLYKTLNNLIDLVRLRHYDVPADQAYTIVDVKSIIEQAVSERAEHYNYFGKIKNIINCPDRLLFLEEDMDIIIFEVIDNMFKYSTSNKVEVALNTKIDGYKKLMILTVTNSVSVPLAFNLHDVQPFKQYHRDKNEQQGSGLGLYLTQLIIKRHLGTMEIDTSNPKLFRIILAFPIT